MLLIFTLMMLIQNSNTKTQIIYDFRDYERPRGWLIVNDGVMGGLSKGNIKVIDKSYGLFSGHVSLDNNGGFSLARLSLPAVGTEGFTKVVLEVQGDEKRYQFRLKTHRGQMHSYTKFFQTSGEWETIEIPLAELRPTFRGRALDLPNYQDEKLEEIGLLIGNKKEEDFELKIRSISLK